MKKIIAAIDGLKFSESTMKYAVQVAKQLMQDLCKDSLQKVTAPDYSNVKTRLQFFSAPNS